MERMTLKLSTTGAALAALLLVAGCGGDDELSPEEEAERAEQIDEAIGATDDEEDEEDQTVEEEPASGWTEDDFEYTLAVAGEGKRLDTDDPIIDSYAAALDASEQHCPEERSMIGDIAVGSVQLLDDDAPGHSETALTMLEAIADSAEAAEGMECSSVAASLVALIVQGGS